MENTDNHPCNACIKFKVFGKACWYYWEGKKVCTMIEEE